MAETTSIDAYKYSPPQTALLVAQLRVDHETILSRARLDLTAPSTRSSSARSQTGSTRSSTARTAGQTNKGAKRRCRSARTGSHSPTHKTR